MNIIEPGLKLGNSSLKLIHCEYCDTTFAGKKIPDICPQCSAAKKGKKIRTANEDECDDFMRAYMEMQEEETGSYEEDGDSEEADTFEDEGESSPVEQEQSVEEVEEIEYDPIGYSQEDFMDSLVAPKKLTVAEKKDLLKSAEEEVRSRKKALQKAGLPADGVQSVLNDIRIQADKLGVNLPAYTDYLLKMLVDRTLQHELMQPGRNTFITRNSVTEKLQLLNIDTKYWNAYYELAGI